MSYLSKFLGYTARKCDEWGICYSTDNYLRVCGQVNLSVTINIVCSLLNIVPFVRRKLPLVLSKGWIGNQKCANVQIAFLYDDREKLKYS